MTPATKKDADEPTDTRRGAAKNEAALYGARNEGKILLINELCEQWKYSRKHAIKLLNGKVGCAKKSSRKKGRPSLYGKEIKEILLCIWKASEQPCGKRLAAMMELWLPHY